MTRTVGAGFASSFADESGTVEQPTADLLAELGWQVVNLRGEKPGAGNPTGRASFREAVLPARLRPALARLNPALPQAALDDAVADLVRDRSAMLPVAANREVWRLLRDGVQVQLRGADGAVEPALVRVLDWADKAGNDFLLAAQPTFQSALYTRRPDLVGFVNGLPLLLIECKAPGRPLADAHENNLRDYRDTIPALFPFNGAVVLTNGIEARIGAATAPFSAFAPWPRLAEDAPDSTAPEVLLRAVCAPSPLLDMVESFTVFEEERGGLVKKLARYHQVLGVNRAIESVRRAKSGEGEAGAGRLGVVWHTQGSGKSLSMVFFTEKVLRTLGNNWTFVLVTDRDELDDQIAETYARTGALTKAVGEAQAQSRADLKRLLAGQERYVFTLIHKFGTERGEAMERLSERRDIIVITDEAHRSQYDQLALNMRQALPNASFLGFTGTPLIAGSSERTREVFGDYVSVYDFAQSIADGATVPLFYDERKPELHLRDGVREEWAELVEEAGLDDEAEAALQKRFARQHALITNPDRQDKIAADLVRHLAGRGYRGKAMFVAIDKAAAVAMYDRVRVRWAALIAEEEQARGAETDEGRAERLAWMQALDMAVVVSSGQNEIADLAARGLDIKPHRERMAREDLAAKFKQADDPLALVFVCAMWITGFDVPTCSTMYLDKPLRNHTLMQTIARANRRAAGKQAGIIVDYVGVFTNLQRALAVYASPRSSAEPIQDIAALVAQLEAALEEAEAEARDAGADLPAILAVPKTKRAGPIGAAAEAVVAPDERRRAFLRLADAAVRAFKAVLPDNRAALFMPRVATLSIVADAVRGMVGPADLSSLAARMEALLQGAILGASITASLRGEGDGLLDLSTLDFDRLGELFAGQPKMAAEAVREAAEAKAHAMAAANPTRADLIGRLEELVAAYNAATLDAEAFLAKLKEYCADLDEEQRRAAREGLNEAELAIFDLLTRPEPKLTKAQEITVKAAARALISKLESLVAVRDWHQWQQPRAAVLSAIRVELNNLPEEPYPLSLWKGKVEDVWQYVTDRFGTRGDGSTCA